MCVFCVQKGQYMQNKEFKRHIAYEVLTILGTLALLLFVCRLWPILLLVILGIFIAAMRLLFLSARKVENIPPLLPAARPEPTDQDIRDMAFGSMQRRITELVTADFPNARWVWKTPNAMRNIATGNEVRILLNHAGGYREAIVVIRGLQVCSLTYPHAEEVKMPETEMMRRAQRKTRMTLRRRSIPRRIMSIWLLNGWTPMLWNSMSGATRASRKGYPCWK